MFTVFIANLTISNVATISLRYGELTSTLNKQFRETESKTANTLQVGSFGRELNTYLPLILPQIGLSVAFGTFWMRAFFLSAPSELLDAAAVDGANPLQALRHVILPLAAPALLTLGVLVFTWTWNEFLLALVLVSDESIRTLPVGLAFFVGQHSAEVPLLAAAATIVSTPIVILFLIFQRNFIRGMVSGAIRG
jgi:raffinose/stachyose/melibiose transport system permease protein